MRWLPAAVLIFLAACQSTEKVIVRPLPDDAPAMTFAEVLARTRTLANQANEQFFLDAWSDLEQTASSLEQSARFLKKSSSIPSVRQPDLNIRAEELERTAKGLLTAAKAKDVAKTNTVLRQINTEVRSLWASN